MVGFHGTSKDDPWVQGLTDEIVDGRVGGLIFFRHNFESVRQAEELVGYFAGLSTEYPLFLAVDQEGGQVQRLGSKLGFPSFESPRTIACSYTAAEARDYYRTLAEVLRSTHLNLNFAPCVDLDHEPPCPVIGGLGRSFDADPRVVTEYAESCLEAFRDAGVIGCLKHFPGHGSAQGDTHEGLVDITGVWREEELEPYRALVAKRIPMGVMTSHLVHRTIDPDHPATLSRTWLDKLRKELGFDGVIFSDDLYMGAIVKNFGLEDAVVRALEAGVDQVIVSNNPLAAKGVEGMAPALETIDAIHRTIAQGIDTGRIPGTRVEEGFARVTALKSFLPS